MAVCFVATQPRQVRMIVLVASWISGGLPGRASDRVGDGGRAGKPDLPVAVLGEILENVAGHGDDLRRIALNRVKDPAMASESAETAELLGHSAAGDEEVLRQLFARHRDRRERVVHLRLSRRLTGPVDDSGLIQEAFLEAC
jgi:hypothetical protein